VVNTGAATIAVDVEDCEAAGHPVDQS
jgi:hypothetical protein